MANFTNGVVSFTRRVNTGNYEHQEAKAEINWLAHEGDTQVAIIGVMQSAEAAAVVQVRRMLGLEVADAPIGQPAPVAEVQHNQLADAEAAEEVAPAVRRPGRPRKVNVEPPVEGESVNTSENAAPPSEPEVDIHSPAPMSTAEFCKMIEVKNAERLARPPGTLMEDGRDGRASQVLVDLVGQYVAAPLKSKDIPVERRAAFLADLAKL